MAERILVVEDDLSMREFLQILLRRQGYEVNAMASAEEALESLGTHDVDLVLTDLNLPGMDGLELLRRLRVSQDAQEIKTPVVLITAFGTAAHAANAMKEGAADYVLKPFDNDELLINIQKLLHRREILESGWEGKELREKFWFDNLVGASSPMLEIYHMVQRLKDSPISLLLQGESGTGKEMVARAIHYSGKRKDGAFVAVNCGAIPDTLIESELFGYKKGAFTGATRDKIGYFQAANGGTIFLDEVGEMPPHAQVALLRALAERRVTPVGGIDEVALDVRVIAASNKDLQKEVKKGNFREDLFYRLNVVRLDLPPLRDRQGDIELLAMHFARHFSRAYKKNVEGFERQAMSLMENYDWPGNVRELRNAVEGAVALTGEKLISVASLPAPMRGHRGVAQGASQVGSGNLELGEEGIHLDEVLAHLERQYLQEALRRTEGHKTQAAQLLGMSFRSFRYRLAKLGLESGESDSD